MDAFQRIAAIVDDGRIVAAPETETRPQAATEQPSPATSSAAGTAAPSRAPAPPSALPPSPGGAFPPPSQAGGLSESDDNAGGGAAEFLGLSDEEREEEERRADELRQAALHSDLCWLPRTDQGNAERFRRRFGDSFRHCVLGWYVWDTRRWSRKEADGRLMIASHQTARFIQDEAKAMAEAAEKVKGKAKKKELLAAAGSLAGWGRQSENNAKISPIGKFAAPYLRADLEDFDRDPFMFNVANGTLVFDREKKKILFKPHDRADMISRLSPVLYNPKAKCPAFDAFINRVQPGADNRRFLQAWLGYSLTGDAEEHKLALLWGRGRNGKGVLMETAAWISGDYARTTPIETFLAEGSPRNASQATPERAALPGVRLLRAGEPKKGSNLDEGFIKLCTGGDQISARDLHKSQFEFFPVFKLTLSMNNKLVVKDTTDSIWARLQLVPFTVQIPESEQDPQLKQKLRAEGSGILNWLLAGLVDWMKYGLVRSQDIDKATADYRNDSDQLGRFLADCTKAAPGERVQSSILYELFVAWSKATGSAEWKQTGFTNAMKDRGFETEKSNVMFFRDITATKDVRDFVDFHGNVVGGKASDQRPGEEEEIAF